MTARRRQNVRPAFLAVAMMVPLLLAAVLVVAEWTGYGGARAEQRPGSMAAGGARGFVVAVPRPPGPDVEFGVPVPALQEGRSGEKHANGNPGEQEGGVREPRDPAEPIVEVPDGTRPGTPGTSGRSGGFDEPGNRGPRGAERRDSDDENCPSGWRGTWLWESCQRHGGVG